MKYFSKYLLLLGVFVSLYAAPPAITGTMSMQELSKLTASDAELYDRFGSSIASSGGVVVVGTAGSESAYVYTFDPLLGALEQVAILSAPVISEGDHFGENVAISGDTIVIGAHGDDTNGAFSGVAYIFEKPASGWESTNISKKLSALYPDENDMFGIALAINAETIVVGASGDDDRNPEAGAVYIFQKPDSGWADITQHAKLTSSDAGGSDFFGKSVAISSDDTIVVGAYRNDGGFTDSGSAYIFQKPTLGWVDMNQSAKLTSSSAGLNNYMGNSVAISGNTVVVGAPLDDDWAGSVYVFEKPEEGWLDMNESVELKATNMQYSNGSGYFGWRVSISGDRIIVGSPEDITNSVRTGSAYMYKRVDSQWIGDMQLIASDSAKSDQFGRSVLVNSGTVFVGSYRDDEDGSSSGSVYHFNEGIGANVTENETLAIKLQAEDPEGDTITYSILGGEDSSAFSVDALSGAVSFKKAPDFEKPHDSNGDGIYKLWVNVADTHSESSFTSLCLNVSDLDYEGESLSAENSQEVQEVIGSKTTTNDSFGSSVALSKDILVVSAYNYDNKKGMVTLFKYNSSLKQYDELAILTASDAEDWDYFGRSVAISGDRIVVGAHYKNGDTAIHTGAAYLFEKPSTGWRDMNESAKLIPLDELQQNAGFGKSVAISGDTIVVGADRQSDEDGFVYIFERDVAEWTQKARLSSSDPLTDYLGRSIAISGDTIVIGARAWVNGIYSVGAAYVYEKPCLGWADMNESATLTPSDAVQDLNFAWNVAISGDTVVAGVHDYYSENGLGAAYIYEKPDSGWKDMNQSAKLTNPSGYNTTDNFSFGEPVAISGDTIVVGAMYYSDNGIGGYSELGSIYVFEKPENGWVDTDINTQFTASDASSESYLGSSIAIRGGIIAAGANGADGNANDSGSVYIYQDSTIKDERGSPISPAILMYLLN